MSRHLLASWLKLPESPWPPNYYALLGLAPGDGGADDIEQRVLQLMETLRHHQLMHPEQVTEGMNLLAKAMNCLTDPGARLKYDQSIGVRSEQAAPVKQEIFDEIPIVPVIEVPPAQTKPARPTRVAEPVAAPAAPPVAPAAPQVYSLDDGNPAAPPPAPYVELPAEDIVIPELDGREPLQLPEDELSFDEDVRFDVGEALGRKERPPPAAKPDQAEQSREARRKIYADIVRVRRVLRIWEQLRQFLEDPNEAFTTVEVRRACLACLADLRQLLPTVRDLVGGPNQPGSQVAALARQQQIVSVLKTFLPSQRGALAQDCRLAYDELLGRYLRLREEIRVQTAKSFGRRVWRPMCRAMIARPEWILLILSIVALAISLVRSL